MSVKFFKTKRNLPEEKTGYIRRRQEMEGRYCITIATRFLTLGAATILSCLLISIGMYQFRQAKEVANIASRRMSEFALRLSQEELTAYDGIYLKGSDVVNFYRRFLYGESADFVMVLVKGEEEYTLAAGMQTKLLTEPDEKSYCRPDASYRCEVVRNANEIIQQVRFVEQDGG